MEIIFDREYLIGEQELSTISNFDNYLESLLNPFNNIITTKLLELEALQRSIIEPIKAEDLIGEIETKHKILSNTYILSNNNAALTSSANTYITELNTLKSSFTTILNSKALTTEHLTRPILKTIIQVNNSAITKQYAIDTLNTILLPTPIPNTKLYVNRTGTGFLWA